MDKNFKVRFIAGSVMFTIALIALYTFDSVPFKIIYALFAFTSVIELLSFFEKGKVDVPKIILAGFEIILLICSTIFVARTNLEIFWYIILGVPGYDIFAYIFGKIFGGKVFGKSRPFPKISKNKTWEGTILGLVTSIALTVGYMGILGTFEYDWMFIFCGPLALAGDLFESHLKRKFDVKDSNEIVIKNKFFRALETLVGGSEGHGGFLDRIDSTAFTATIMLILTAIVW